MSQFHKIKIKVGSSEQSVAIQEFLFTQGCRWNLNGQTVQRITAKYLFVESGGSIGWDDSDSFFNDRTPDYTEVIFVTGQKLVVLAHAPKERPKTVLFGKTYYTDDLNARLEGLKTC